jgi:transmembrane sensor
VNEARLNELIIKYLNRIATPEEKEALLTWLDDNPSLKLEVTIIEEYWSKTNVKNADLDQAYAQLQRKIHEVEIQHKRTRHHTFIHYFSMPAIKWVAASLILFFSSITAYQLWMSHHRIDYQPPKNWQLTYDQPGMRSKLILPDSTEVWLNGDTRLYYPDHFGRQTREVWLSGEAYFKVKHDPGRMFIIHTSKMNIKVLGTEFNVKCYPDDPLYETSLFDGAILVSLKDRPEDRIILKPKEKLVVVNDQVMLQKQGEKLKPLPSDISEKLSTKLWVTDIHYFSSHDSVMLETGWLEGKLVFRDENFPDLAKRFERWYGYHIQFMDDSVKQYHFTGIFEHETLEQALKALQIAEKFHYQINDQDSTVFIY